MKALTLFSSMQAAVDEGLTFAEVLADIPHDAAAVVVYILVGFSIGLVVWSGRRGAPRDPQHGQ